MNIIPVCKVHTIANFELKKNKESPIMIESNQYPNTPDTVDLPRQDTDAQKRSSLEKLVKELLSQMQGKNCLAL